MDLIYEGIKTKFVPIQMNGAITIEMDLIYEGIKTLSI